MRDHQANHQRATEVFLAARNCPPNEIDAFLQEQCAGDQDLLDQVRRMFEQDTQSDSPLDAGLLGVASGDGVFAGAAAAPAPLQAGGGIGPYTIIREIGRGGMGVVYLATDTRLDRQVAIKALPAHLANDPDRLARFQREAKVLASLNHPNIGAIYGIEEANGQQYLVLEYIQGETLDARLQRGSLSVDDALECAVHIAKALDSAHLKGVIHRDLKPGNIMITPDGAVKVLDFGLARKTETTDSAE